MEITWLGHSTFQFVLPSGETILVDPWVDGNPMFPKHHTIDRVDTILLSHGHFDHSNDVVRLAKQFSPIVVSNFEICTWLQKQGVKNTQPMNKGGSQRVGGIDVAMTHAFHSSSIQDGDTLLYGGEPAGFVLQFEDDRSCYFAGDTALFGDMELIAELYQPSLAFLPIGDLFTMGPEQAAIACQLLNVDKVIPMHFGTFPGLTGTPEKLFEILGDESTEVWTLTPGNTVTW